MIIHQIASSVLKGLAVAIISLPIAVPIVISPYTAIAQESNFGKLVISAEKPSGRLTGTTGGSSSLAAIIGNSDRHNHKCLGFGDPKPDHLLILNQNFSSLSLRVRSGIDTTLVVQGADDTIRCGDDTSTSKDASLTDTDWKAGTYKIWVGTSNPGIKKNYTLIVQP